ncbi:hypothetical protein B5P44_04390 [Mycobacterium sp. CBMA 213]|nr:hypothetical protein [Mycolicibacterium sp. CBMA 213]
MSRRRRQRADATLHYEAPTQGADSTDFAGTPGRNVIRLHTLQPPIVVGQPSPNLNPAAPSVKQRYEPVWRNRIEAGQPVTNKRDPSRRGRLLFDTLMF